jgi:murein DD-endopeptidase MepM/ murein hydrolase activator NlpD
MQDLPVRGLPLHVPTDILSRSPERLQNRLRAAEGADAARRDSELKKASREFESIFVAYLLKVMRDTIEESGLTEGGLGKGIYTELFDQEVSRGIAQHGALGIAELLYGRLSARMPESGAGAERMPFPSRVPSAPRETAPPEPESEIPDFSLPLQAPVSSNFGPREDPVSHRPSFHKGIDLAAPEGTEVRAARGGEVLFVGYDGGYGNSVVVRHSQGFQTRYAHLGSVNVKAGETVEDEQLLGVVGNTGRSTGPHLHFEVIRNGEQVNPGTGREAE